MVERNHKAGQNPPRIVASPEEEEECNAFGFPRDFSELSLIWKSKMSAMENTANSSEEICEFCERCW
jgi:hypothetical protein